MSRNKHLIFLAFIICLMCVLYGHIFVWMYGRWVFKGSYYSHGFLIPLMSAYLVWRRRKELATVDISTGNAGLILILFGCLGHILSSILEIYFISALLMLMVVLGIIYYLYGIAVTRILFFPILYLFFMIPMPMISIADISLRLKLLTTRWALWFVSWFGINTVQDGSTVYFNNGLMIVGDICSGMKSLISILAFGTFYIVFTSFGWFRKSVLFILCAPIAVLSNLVRIIVLCFIAGIWSPQHASGWVHDASGILIFIVAFALIVGVHRILELRIFSINKGQTQTIEHQEA
ncbi:MAG: exosortase/archaeosortase family protein [Chlamydiota bacterium]|nr:exosortase/archaeosortase family protein [Chlamydiota bacterium]